MIRIIFIFNIFFLFSLAVHASEPNDCGYIRESLVEDVYQAAERVEYYNDVTGDIEHVCDISQEFLVWDKARIKEKRLSRAERKHRDHLIDVVEQEFQALRGRLISLYGYLYAERNGESRAVRAARIRSAHKKVSKSRDRLLEKTDALRDFMSL